MSSLISLQNDYSSTRDSHFTVMEYNYCNQTGCPLSADKVQESESRDDCCHLLAGNDGEYLDCLYFALVGSHGFFVTSTFDPPISSRCQKGQTRTGVRSCMTST